MTARLWAICRIECTETYYQPIELPHVGLEWVCPCWPIVAPPTSTTHWSERDVAIDRLQRLNRPGNLGGLQHSRGGSIPVMATMDSAMQFSPCSSGLRRSPAELESSRCSYGYRMVTRKAPCFGDAPGGNRTRGLRLERPLSGRWHRLSLRRSAYCHCLGWSFGWSSISGPPKGPRCCPLAPEIWLCSWVEEGGPRLS